MAGGRGLLVARQTLLVELACQRAGLTAQAAGWCRATSMSAGVSDGYSSMIASVP